MVDLVHLLGHKAERNGTGHVGAVALVEAAEVHRDEIAVLEHTLTGNAVRHAGVRAGNDDRLEGQALAAVLIQAVDQLRRDLFFRHAGLDDLAHLAERRVGDLLRLAHQLQLPRLLARAEGADLLLIRLEHGVQLGIVLRELAVGEIILLKAERLDGFGLDGAVDAQDIAVIAVNHLDGKVRQIFFCGFDIAAVGKIIAPVLADDGDALGNVVLRGIVAADLAGQEQCVHLAGFQQGLHFIKVFHVEFSFFQWL